MEVSELAASSTVFFGTVCHSITILRVSIMSVAATVVCIAFEEVLIVVYLCWG